MLGARITATGAECGAGAIGGRPVGALRFAGATLFFPAFPRGLYVIAVVVDVTGARPVTLTPEAAKVTTVGAACCTNFAPGLGTVLTVVPAATIPCGPGRIIPFDAVPANTTSVGPAVPGLTFLGLIGTAGVGVHPN